VTDIVEWLREKSSEHNMYRCDEAADRIEQLEATLKIAQENLDLLDALMEAGVDNWSGYDHAIDILESKNGQ